MLIYYTWEFLEVTVIVTIIGESIETKTEQRPNNPRQGAQCGPLMTAKHLTC